MQAPKPEFFERQVGGLCRVHACNNALGYRAFDGPDRFDEAARRRSHKPGPGHADAVFSDGSLILAAAIEDLPGQPYTTMSSPQSAAELEVLRGAAARVDVVGVLAWNDGHVVALRRLHTLGPDVPWALLDSMAGGPRPVHEPNPVDAARRAYPGMRGLTLVVPREQAATALQALRDAACMALDWDLLPDTLRAAEPPLGSMSRLLHQLGPYAWVVSACARIRTQLDKASTDRILDEALAGDRRALLALVDACVRGP